MSIVKMPARTIPEPEVGRLAPLTVELWRRLRGISEPEGDSVIAKALDQIASLTHARGVRVVELAESGSVGRTHLRTPGTSQAPALEATLVERLLRGEVVDGSILGVPASIGGKVTCALVIEGSRLSRPSQQALVDHLQLLTEIIGAAFLRWRPDATDRADGRTIERLNDRLAADNLYLKEELKSRHDFYDIVGDSDALGVALARVAQVASTSSSVLLLGPTGTGKELFARAVHERSRRHARPLMRVNCAALPPTLVESELFGHEKGAFTGAVAARQGRFELADGGTIFLDEIGDLSPEVQVKFLRVLQEGEFERVGSSRTRRVDVRVIAATHHDLEAAVAEGRFRSDLYYRLNVYPIRLPALKERSEDIPQLVWFFIKRHEQELGRRITKVPQSVMDALQGYAWPGNVRELENVIERAMIESTGETLGLDSSLPWTSQSPAPAEPDDSLELLQRSHIRAVLERCGWRIDGPGHAADRLGIHPSTLRFRMKKLGVQRYGTAAP